MNKTENELNKLAALVRSRLETLAADLKTARGDARLIEHIQELISWEAEAVEKVIQEWPFCRAVPEPEKDKARLDWLSTKRNNYWCCFCNQCLGVELTPPDFKQITFREAIDATMAAESKV